MATGKLSNDNGKFNFKIVTVINEDQLVFQCAAATANALDHIKLNMFINSDEIIVFN